MHSSSVGMGINKAYLNYRLIILMKYKNTVTQILILASLLAAPSAAFALSMPAGLHHAAKRQRFGRHVRAVCPKLRGGRCRYRYQVFINKNSGLAWPPASLTQTCHGARSIGYQAGFKKIRGNELAGPNCRRLRQRGSVHKIQSRGKIFG